MERTQGEKINRLKKSFEEIQEAIELILTYKNV